MTRPERFPVVGETWEHNGREANKGYKGRRVVVTCADLVGIVYKVTKPAPTDVRGRTVWRHYSRSVSAFMACHSQIDLD